MGHGDVDSPFPENLRNPVDGEPATMSLQDLLLAFSRRFAFGVWHFVLFLESGDNGDRSAIEAELNEAFVALSEIGTYGA
jgi:hypothetical protein